MAGRRYDGTISQFRPDKGFGFIRCEELRRGPFPEKDVFLHRLQIQNFKEGDPVSFTLILNKEGKPQATQLGPPCQGTVALTAPAPGQQFQQPLVAIATAAPVAAAAPVSPTFINPTPPPAPAAPAPVEVWDKHEVEVPAEFVPKLMGPVLLDVKQRAGNDISISVDTVGQEPVRKVVIQGPKMSASLGTCLLLEQVAQLM